MTDGFTKPVKSNSVVIFLDPFARTTTSPLIACKTPSSKKTASDCDGSVGVVVDK